MKMMFRASLFALLCIAPVTAQSTDLTLIRQLPQRLATMKKEGHKKWDTGITATMLEGTKEFNNGLVGILRELIRAHAKERFIEENEVDAYLHVLVSKLKFEKKLGNPRGEDRGSLARFDIPAGLSVELENSIVFLVQGIVEDQESFDVNAWRKEWKQASEEGD